MSGLFGGKVAKQAPEFASLMVQTAMWGRPIPLAYGLTRLAGNLVWYGDFTPVAHTQSTGGKGGGGGGGSTTSYTYTAAVVLALCEGPILDVTQSWAGKTQGTPQTLNLTEFLGAIGQAEWTYLDSYHPAQAIGYSHIAYLASAAYDLGSAASLPNHNFEVKGPLYNSTGVSNIPDAAVDQVLTDVLTNQFYGAGFPSAKLGSTAQMASYCRSHGIWISPLYAEPETAASIVKRLAEIGNTALVFSEGVLKFLPFGDTVLTGNGVTFTPVTAVQYSLTDNDFLHDGGDNPVLIKRSTPADAFNTVRVNFRDRTADYSTAPQEAKESDAIQKYGLRIAPNIDYKEICDPDSARMVAQLMLQRSLYQRNTYEFTVGLKYCLLEPMDLVNLTELTGTGLLSQTVQITSIEETEDGKLKIAAQDWLGTVHSAPIFQYQTKGGYTLNLNAPPGSIEDPLIFDAPSQMAVGAGYEIWVAAAGLNTYWGGCDVWVSTDGATYKKVGEIKARARYGVLSAALAVGTDPDTTNSFSVDLTTSLGALSTGTQASADALNTLCFVSGELVSYMSASLYSTNSYNVGTYLRRGVYGTPITAHAIGDDFARIDSALFRYPYDPALVGTTIFLKFTSKNVWGGAEESLANVLAYNHTITGPIGAPAAPASMSATVGPSSIILNWAAVGTPNLMHYEVRQGATWDTAAYVAQSLTTQLKIPPQAVGLNQWWVKAIDHAGVYSQTAATASLQIVAPSAPVVTALVIDNNLQLSWSASVSTQPILTYEVRRGATFETANIVGSKNGLFTTIIENLAGTFTYWVVGIDIGGNFGTPAPLQASIAAPPDYLIALNAGWPNVLSGTDRTPALTGTKVLKTTATAIWGSARARVGYPAGQWYWEVHVDSVDVGGNHIMVGVGTSAVPVTATNYVGLESHGYAYYGFDGKSYHGGSATALGATYTTGDLIGVFLDVGAGTVQFYKNGAAQGSALAIGAGTWFPMVSLYDSACQVRINFGDTSFVFPPADGVNGLASNAVLDSGTVVMPMDVATTYQAHFTAPAWASPNDQVIAGFPVFGEKSVAAGYFEQVYDVGQTLGGAKVTVTPTVAVGDGAPVITTDIAVSSDNVTFTNTVGVSTLFANSFRYVKVRVNVTSSGNDDLAAMSALTCLVEVKLKTDQGNVSCVSTDSGGTTTPFNIPFLNITAINLSPDSTSAVIPVVSFAGGANPTSFKALLFNTTGTRISGTARWIARGY